MGVGGDAFRVQQDVAAIPVELDISLDLYPHAGFPDAWHSARDIKILYGMEGYFVNNLDDRIPVHGHMPGFTSFFSRAFSSFSRYLVTRRDVLKSVISKVRQKTPGRRVS